MRDIIHQYKLRLTNLSQANRSLKLARLSKRADMDLLDLGWIDDWSAEEILHRILAGKNAPLLRSLDPRHEPANLADQRLNHIFRRVGNLFEETGTYDLCLGYPWVEGRFAEGSIVRCPLVLFPVRLERKLQSRPRWHLSIKNDQPASLNQTFFLAYERFQRTRLPEAFWEEELLPHKNHRDWIQQLYDLLKKYEIGVNFNSELFDQKLKPFHDYQKATLEAFKTGVLTLQPQAVLGLFPQSDSALLQDYQIIEQEPGNYRLRELLGKVALAAPQEPEPIREEDRYFVTELDQSQEETLLKIKQGRSAVIHGPPGTGKSQVIVNLIADALAHGQRVLLVSQKRAALDVVQNRLQALGLDRFSMLVHDYRQDRADIFGKLRRQIENIDQFRQDMRDLNLTRLDLEYKRFSREIDQTARNFDALADALQLTLDCGLSLHQLYLRTDAKRKMLPVSDHAPRFNLAQLEHFLQKLRFILDYAEFYQPDHPWQNRLSQHIAGPEDQERVLKSLGILDLQLKELHREHASLTQFFGRNFLEDSKTAKFLTQLREVEADLENPELKHQLTLLPLSSEEVPALKAWLQKLEMAVAKLEDLKILDDGHWLIQEDLENHRLRMQEENESPLKWLNLGWLKARWAYGKILRSKERAYTPQNVALLSGEVERFTTLRRLFSRKHEDPFFEDFPLLGNQAEKKSWIEKKGLALASWERMQILAQESKLPHPFQGQGNGAEKWREVTELSRALEEFHRKLKTARQEWEAFLHPAQIGSLMEAFNDEDLLLDRADRLLKSYTRDRLDLRSLDQLLAELEPRERDLLEQIEKLFQVAENLAEFGEDVRHSFYRAWIERAERSHPEVTAVSTRGWARQQAHFAELVEKKRRLVVDIINYRVKERIVNGLEFNRLGNRVTYRELHHQVRKKRRLWPLRKLIGQFWEKGLSSLAPCWMASPESVSALFPMQADFFDLVIFDEASQCFVERGVPALLRGQQVVVAGDEHQLQPSDLYTVRIEEDDEILEAAGSRLEAESILDLARGAYLDCHLSWHYRSQDAALIQFSNQAFYEGRLQVMPRAAGSDWQPLIWKRVPGRWVQRQNPVEAQAVIALIKELIRREDRPSLGVVTFNFHQQELIGELLDRELEHLAESDPQEFELLQASMQKTEAEAFQGIFVKNIENVQGDERDIIIFSTGYAPDENGKLHTRFGLLNQRGGENRLNVAITRARKQVFLLCSFRPSELHVDGSANPGPKLFRDYLQFAHDYKAIGPAVVPIDEEQQTGSPSKTSLIAEWLAERLVSEGYEVTLNVGDTRFRLDMAVRKQGQPNWQMGIECEGPNYFSGITAREREVYRPRLLKDLGWKLHRVWARNFWQDREKELKKILEKLTDQKKSRV